MNFYTDREKKIAKEIISLFKDNKCLSFEDEKYAYYKSTFEKLVDDDYVHNINADNAHVFYKNETLSYFEEELKDQEREERKLSRREWKISIISAIIGAAIGLIPTIIMLFVK